MRRLGVLVAALAVAVAIATTGGSAATARTSSGVFTGYGFEACTAPSVAKLQAWSVSPYRALGIYLGGVNRACQDGNLSATWVSTTLSMGWSLMPLYVGLQAPCVTQAKLQRLSLDAVTAANQGRAAADDAVGLAAEFGIATGSPIYYDMEGYSTTNAACSQAVQVFVAAWVNELHARGYVAGVYGSAASTIRDVAAGAVLPDDVWIANWNGVEDVFGDPYVSDGLWTNHQRIHQYKGGHNETWGGATINIDSDYVDGAVVGGSSAPLPPPPPPVTPPSGSVGSGDGKATASWPETAFSTSSVVTLTPTTTAPAPNGYGVQLTVSDSATATPVTLFAAPVTVHLLMTTGGLAPSWSTDGTTWTPLRLLTSPTLPAGVDAGYTLDPDGTIEIQTLVPAFFGLLPDTVPPSQPQIASARFANGSLTIRWQASTDNSGTIASYQVLLDGTQVSSLKGTVRKVSVRAFHPAAQTVYRIQAVDPSGVQSRPSRPVVIRPSQRPTTMPRKLPAWAWVLLAWQHTPAPRAPRPAVAPRIIPAWYWDWAAWRNAPFRVVR